MGTISKIYLISSGGLLCSHCQGLQCHTSSSNITCLRWLTALSSSYTLTEQNYHLYQSMSCNITQTSHNTQSLVSKLCLSSWHNNFNSIAFISALDGHDSKMASVGETQFLIYQIWLFVNLKVGIRATSDFENIRWL